MQLITTNKSLASSRAYSSKEYVPLETPQNCIEITHIYSIWGEFLVYKTSLQAYTYVGRSCGYRVYLDALKQTDNLEKQFRTAVEEIKKCLIERALFDIYHNDATVH